MSNLYHTDEQIFINQLEDKIIRATQWYAEQVTNFLEPSLQIVAEEILTKKGVSTYCFWGGYSDAERKRLLIFPEYMEPQEDLAQVALVKLAGNFKYVNVSHRDFLGAVMSLGIKREKIGDLIVVEDGCYVIISEELKDYFLMNNLKIKSVPVKVTIEPWDQIELPEITVKECSVMVASMRLDTIVAHGFDISRTKSMELIQSGKIKVNWKEVNSNDYLCKEQDSISCRGKGKMVIGQISGSTKKGKIRLNLIRYI